MLKQNNQDLFTIKYDTQEKIYNDYAYILPVNNVTSLMLLPTTESLKQKQGWVGDCF